MNGTSLLILACLLIPGFAVGILTGLCDAARCFTKVIAGLIAVAFFPAIYLALCYWLWHLNGR